MHPFDRYFYDRGSGSTSSTTTNSSSTTARNYTVDRYLDDATARYGGLDAALVWPSYPNLGVRCCDKIQQREERVLLSPLLQHPV